MLLVDDRAGSCELVAPLLKLGLPVEKTRLDFGDILFKGRGEKGAPLIISVEHKTVSDLVSSLEGRLQAHQLPGMITTSDRQYLIVEGDWWRDERGAVATFRHGRTRRLKGAPSAITLLQRLIVLHIRMGVTIWPTANQHASVDFIHALYRTWSDKNLDEHKSHLAMYAPDLDKGVFTPPTDFRKAVSVLLPDVSSAVSKAIEDECGGTGVSNGVKLTRMLAWSEQRWAELVTLGPTGRTRRLGTSRAKRIMEALTNGED